MTPERARKIAQECVDSWYGGAASINLKEAITQGIVAACEEDGAALRQDALRYRIMTDGYEMAIERAEKAEAERDALLKVVAAADAMQQIEPEDMVMAHARAAYSLLRTSYIAARAALKEAKP